MKNANLIILLLLSSIVFSKPYKGAEYRTNQSFIYGKFEIRLKSAGISGMLTSFFTYHDNDPDWLRNWNEIDIENMGRYTNESQFNVISPGQTNHVKRQILNFNPHKAFHVYAIEWTPSYISWSIDGYEVYRQYENHISQMNKEQKLMMNIWQPTSVDWAGVFNTADLPVYAYYDWVKYYKYTPGVYNNFTLDWIDNFDSWDTKRWSKATHTFDGNNVDFTPENCVFKDGYMILCLTNRSNTGYNGGAIIDNDIDAPYVNSARAFGDHVLVSFSEKISKESAEKKDNYVIAGSNIKSAQLENDSMTVKLLLENIIPSGTNTLLVLNIEDLAKPKNIMSFQQIKIYNNLTTPVYIEVGGNQWNNYLKDQNWNIEVEYGYEGGAIIQKTGVQINKTEDDEVYRTALEGVEFYKIRLPNGNYNLSLLFAELNTFLPGSRIFDIYVNGILKIENIDISKEVGINSAFDLNIENILVKNNILEIYFKSKYGKTLLNGLKIKKSEANNIFEKHGLNQKNNTELNIYPNPFNLASNFSYFLKESGFMSLIIYDLSGKVISILDTGNKISGNYKKTWNAENIPSGVYFCALYADSKILTKKICLIK